MHGALNLTKIFQAKTEVVESKWWSNIVMSLLTSISNRDVARRDLNEAAAALREAEISLSIALRQAYPQGSSVIVKIGRQRVCIRIKSYGPNGSAPGDVIGENIVTGKTRRFHFRSIQCFADED